jgi:hypothetical protein
MELHDCLQYLDIPDHMIKSNASMLLFYYRL